MFKKFQEYMNARGKIAQPKEKEVADYDGPNPKSPPASKTPTVLDKGMAPPKAKHEPKPYRAVGKPAGSKEAESGLADTGDKNLVYDPDTKNIPKQDNIEGQKRKNYPPNKKTKTEQFLDTTKGMSIHEFTNHMITKRKEGLNDLPVISDNQHPEEIVRYVAVLADKNESILEDLIHSLKRNRCFKKLVESLMEIPEALNMMTELLSDDSEGPRRCRQLVRCMEDSYTESVGPPFGISGDDEGGTNGQPFDVVPGEDEEDEEDEEGADPSPEDEFDTDDEEGEEGEPWVLPEDEFDTDDEEGEEGEEGEEDENEDEDEDEMGEFPKKKKKKFAHDNLLDAMGEYEHMRAKMRGY
jgi:hypothetical protein